jgi:hypothetical protein
MTHDSKFYCINMLDENVSLAIRIVVDCQFWGIILEIKDDFYQHYEERLGMDLLLSFVWFVNW